MSSILQYCSLIYNIYRYILFLQLDDLQRELEETRELANNRLQELDKLHQQHRDTLKEVEKLKMDVSKQFYFLNFIYIIIF